MPKPGKKKEAKLLKQFTEKVQATADVDLNALKEELIKDLDKTSRKKELISLEKRIEAIEDVQATRAERLEAVRRSRKGAKMKKDSIAKFAVIALAAATAAAVCYIKVNDIRFPDIVDMVADLQK